MRGFRSIVGSPLSEDHYASVADLRVTFPSADHVGRFTVFNIGGTTYLLIVAIHYNRRKVYVRHVLTHAEDDRGNWRT